MCPTSAELIDFQFEFEEPRGLLEFNSLPHGFFRMMEEMEEARIEMEKGDYEALLVELADTLIFMHSMFGNIVRKLGLAPEEVDRIIEKKAAQNHVKYSMEFFSEGRSTAEAMALAKASWDLTHHKEQPN